MSKRGKSSQLRASRARRPGAVGPEAQKDKVGFDRAVDAAKVRLAEIEP